MPIAFESRKLIPAKINYSPTELEMLAIVYCCQKWRVYIEGRDVHVHTDHKPNVTFDKVNMANSRHARWLDALQGHRLIWHSVKGVAYPADSLSRYPVCFVGMTADQRLHFVGTATGVLTPLQSLLESLSFVERVKAAYKPDPWFTLTNTAALTFTYGLYFRGDALCCLLMQICSVMPFKSVTTLFTAHTLAALKQPQLGQKLWVPLTTCLCLPALSGLWCAALQNRLCCALTHSPRISG
jgi:hypothetical protein